MKIWIVMMINCTEPERKVYILGAHSTAEAAGRQRDALDVSGEHATYVVEMEVDGKQPPILVGVARNALGSECKKNTPNG
ncbi:MAG TPA: hypothetical protein ENK48_07620 [Gammaproteobacteria bacterium]|nr:hypothetical protein [Gammaproteobacteria bacterium]